MANRFFKPFALLLILGAAVLFIIRFGGPQLLSFYVRSGLGKEVHLPIFYSARKEERAVTAVSEQVLAQLRPTRMENVELGVPKEFVIFKGALKRSYYKKWPPKSAGSQIHLLTQPKNYFVRLNPQVMAQGVSDDYEFLRRVQDARLDRIRSISDAFFVIMKGIFTPDLGDQKDLRTVTFTLPGKRGFLTESHASEGDFYDCNFFDDRDRYFKLYIKDLNRSLSRSGVLAIVSTVRIRPD